MSTSPNDQHDEPADKSVDELADASNAVDDAEPGTSNTVVKRGRGRPKGSKNKKSGASSSAPESPTTPTLHRKRGRPPKEKKDDSGEEPTPKRPRGRPPKNPKPVAAPVEAAVTSDSGDASAKKKRGRPPKKTTA